MFGLQVSPFCRVPNVLIPVLKKSTCCTVSPGMWQLQRAWLCEELSVSTLGDIILDTYVFICAKKMLFLEPECSRLIYGDFLKNQNC